MYFSQKINLFHKYIFTKKEIPEDHLKELSSLPHTYLFRAYCFSNPILGKFLNSICNDISVIYTLDSLSLLNYLKLFYNRFGYVNYPTMFKGGKKKKLEVPKKIRGQLGDQETELFNQWLQIEADDLIRDTLLTTEDKEKKSFKKIKKQLLKNKKIIKGTKKNISSQYEKDILSNGEIYSNVCLPKKYYSNKYTLLDVQYFQFKTLRHIFRNMENGKKQIVDVSANKFKYYYMSKDDVNTSSPIMNVKNTICYKGKLKEETIKRNLNVYENDISAPLKAASDYYFNAKDNVNYNVRTFYYDLELCLEDEGSLNRDKAQRRISYISAFYLNKYYVWCLEGDTQNEIEYIAKSGKYPLVIRSFNNNESLLLQDFIQTIFYLNPDTLTAWNSDFFDFPYLVNRCKRVPYIQTEFYTDNYENVYQMMKQGDKREVIVEDRKHYVTRKWTGFIITDLMVLYKNSQQNSKESWSLAFISNEELGSEFSKLKMPSSDGSIEDWIKYNVRDTECMVEIDLKCQLHNFRYVIMKLAKCTWEGTYSSFGLIMGFLLNYAKTNNIVLRSKISSEVFDGLSFFDHVIGGYVQSTTGGLFDWVVDFDAASMYPSIIRTFNIGPNTLRMTINYKDSLNIMKGDYNPESKIDVIYNELDVNISTTGYVHKQPQQIKIKKLLQIIKDKKYMLTPAGAIFCSHDEEESIYYKILTNLYHKRQNVKKQMYDKNGNKISSMYNKQWAIKIAMNSFYGVFGFASFIFFSETLANSITITGRLFIKTLMLGTEKILKNASSKWNNEERLNTKKELISLSNKKEFTHKCFKELDVIEQDDVKYEYCIYADTDGMAVTFFNFFNIDDSLEDQLKDIDEIVDFTNISIDNINENIYNLFMKDKNDKHRYMSFKEEWFADKALFYKNKKKRYALHVVKEDGEMKNDFVYRGIDVRRSDFPRVVKDKLDYLLKKILTCKKFNAIEIMNDVDRIEGEILTLIKNGDISVGKPVSFTKELSEYKNRPQHLDGMLLWNHISQTETFKPATKGYLFYMNGIDESKLPSNFEDAYIEMKLKGKRLSDEFRLNAIVVPETESNVPKWADINIKKSLEFLWKDRYSNVLEPVLTDYFETDIDIGGFDFLK